MVCIHPLWIMLKSWATQNRIVPQDWKDLVIAVLEASPQLSEKYGEERYLGS